MPTSRRKFLTTTSLGALGTAIMGQSQTQQPTQPQPGAPPAFGTAPPVGPEVSSTTFSEAEKLVQVKLSGADRNLAAASWRSNLASLYERRTGPHKVELEPALAPWSHSDPVLPGQTRGPERDQFIRSKVDAGPLPEKSEDIAFAPLTRLRSGRRVKVVARQGGAA